MFPAWADALIRQELEALADPGPNHPTPATLASINTASTSKPTHVDDYLDAREILKFYRAGLAPECLPIGEFVARHYGTGLDCDVLEHFFNASGVEVLCIEVIRVRGRMDFAYRLRR